MILSDRVLLSFVANVNDVHCLSHQCLCNSGVVCVCVCMCVDVHVRGCACACIRVHMEKGNY